MQVRSPLTCSAMTQEGKEKKKKKRLAAGFGRRCGRVVSRESGTTRIVGWRAAGNAKRNAQSGGGAKRDLWGGKRALTGGSHRGRAVHDGIGGNVTDDTHLFPPSFFP